MKMFCAYDSKVEKYLSPFFMISSIFTQQKEFFKKSDQWELLALMTGKF